MTRTNAKYKLQKFTPCPRYQLDAFVCYACSGIKDITIYFTELISLIRKQK